MTKTVAFKLTTLQYNLLEVLAARQRLSLAELMRKLVDQGTSALAQTVLDKALAGADETAAADPHALLERTADEMRRAEQASALRAELDALEAR